MALTTGLVQACTALSGGLLKVWITDVINVSSGSVTVASDEVTAITLGSGAWYEFEFKEDSGFRRNLGEKQDTDSFIVTHEVGFRHVGTDTATVQSLHELISSIPCGVVALCKDTNGDVWFEGWSTNLLLGRPLKLQLGTLDSGTAIADGTGTDFMLQSADNKYGLKFTGTEP